MTYGYCDDYDETDRYQSQHQHDQRYHRCGICDDELDFIAARERDALCPACWVEQSKARLTRQRDFGRLWGAVIFFAWSVIFVAMVLWLLGVL
jgi:hypothetical protein